MLWLLYSLSFGFQFEILVFDEGVLFDFILSKVTILTVMSLLGVHLRVTPIQYNSFNNNEIASPPTRPDPMFKADSTEF